MKDSCYVFIDCGFFKCFLYEGDVQILFLVFNGVVIVIGFVKGNEYGKLIVIDFVEGKVCFINFDVIGKVQGIIYVSGYILIMLMVLV